MRIIVAIIYIFLANVSNGSEIETIHPKHKKILSRDPKNITLIRYIPFPKGPYVTLRYPFHNQHLTYCSQGNGNLEGSHSHDDILFAIDFITPPENDAAEIYAAHDGIAYIYNQCSFRKNNYQFYNSDGCGEGYGNHVRILHPNGYLTIYAHLSSIEIKHKSQVKVGQKIGIEGISGSAGKRHLHFGFHKPKDLSLIDKQPGYVGTSIPFEMKLLINGKEEILLSSNIPCDSSLKAPLLGGIE